MSFVNLFKPSDLKELCRQYGFSPSKSFGQNFLLSGKPIMAIVKAAELSPEDTVIEIGPGFGALTLAVAPLVREVIAFEIEQTLRPYWEERQSEYGNVRVVWGDALAQLVDYQIKLRELERNGRHYKVLANLPYQITSRALRIVLELDPPPERVIVMVQREVAERICAKAGDMSLLSVSVQYYGDPRIVAIVPRGQFWPVPQVDSAIVAIENIHYSGTTADTNGTASIENIHHKNMHHKGTIEVENFFRMVKAGFAHKRKQAWRNIADELGLPAERVKRVLRDVAGDERARAEMLSVSQWKEVERKLFENQ